ncbi:hypothetical protein D7231_27045 [Streptomyces klenkii]|uniref:Uncharacterized protein n=1 Tax=Streptomyces klenkii TaxID=1420899 RepID=A0A3B0AXF1_9ACTN|nr:hypothetical protein [Streptomyces klenkii]RKN64951.1 hypothetical protein D7231_27045 [Streptomyces klenkii]
MVDRRCGGGDLLRGESCGPAPAATAPGAPGAVSATAAPAFSRGEDTTEYTVAFSLTDGSPVAPALDYRALLQEHGQLGSLKRKMAAVPANVNP